MKILINDYAGHSFTIQLARELAKDIDSTVVYCYFSSDISPKGNLSNENDGLKVIPITIDERFEKYAFFKRRKQELQFARKLKNAIRSERPDTVVSANTPLEVNAQIQKLCIKDNIKFIFWFQDIISFAVKKILNDKFGAFAWPIIWYYRYLERHIARQSDHVIGISNQFTDVLLKWGVKSGNISLLKNWSDTSSIFPVEKRNSWSLEHGLQDKFCLMYSGTLGLKHNPNLFIRLSQELALDKNVIIVVITEGIGSDIIDRFIKRDKPENIILLPYQPIGILSEVLSSADILMAILEESASDYSVPSKILSYMCVGRPILASIPNTNLSSQIVQENNCGFCVKPNDYEAIVEHIKALKLDDDLRGNLGKNGLDYARKNFKISVIAKRFIEICSREREAG